MASTQTNGRRRGGYRGGRQPDPREHGSRKGYRQHQTRGEEACDPCREAEATYQRERYATRVAEGTQPPRKRYPQIIMSFTPQLLEDLVGDDRSAARKARDEVYARIRERLENFEWIEEDEE